MEAQMRPGQAERSVKVQRKSDGKYQGSLITENDLGLQSKNNKTTLENAEEESE